MCEIDRPRGEGQFWDRRRARARAPSRARQSGDSPRDIETGPIGWICRDVKVIDEARIVVSRGREVDRPLAPDYLDPAGPRLARNLRYIGNLIALRAFYHHVRRPRIPAIRGHEAVVIDEAIQSLDAAIAERIARVDAFARERGEAPDLSFTPARRAAEACPIDVVADRPGLDHLEWVRGLDASSRTILGEWLAQIVALAST